MPPTPPPPTEVRITRIGAEGDGLGRLEDDTPLYIPFTLPGETVTARPTQKRGEGWQAQAETITAPGPARVTPPCQHFGTCGGCVLQHWADEEYQAWKQDLLTQALRQAGFPDPTPAYIKGLPAERRRIDFAVRRASARITIGLHQQRSDTIIDITACLVLHPALAALIPPLRPLLQGLTAIRREASLAINLLTSGPDLLLRTDAPLTLDDRRALTNFATKHALPRISHTRSQDAPETIALLNPPATTLSGTTVRPPPGAFLQATAEAERAIIQAVLAAIPKLAGKSRVAELYAGCGTITFALETKAKVTAYEGDAATAAALKQAINAAQKAGRIEAHQRDLARQPLSAKELAAFKAVVLDPPHNGAAAQIAQIAAARTPTVIYVSCNPATLSRDAAILRQAGYSLAAATAIDQFLWSARLESVTVFHAG